MPVRPENERIIITVNRELKTRLKTLYPGYRDLSQIISRLIKNHLDTFGDDGLPRDPSEFDNVDG